ncbi:MAG: Ig domain-containing protein, partial [Deltaproteobacteria bacterium]
MTRFCAWLLLAGSLAACSGGSDDDGTTTPDALELVTTAIASGEFGKAYDEKIAARGGVPPYTFRHVEGDLPGGLMLKAETGQLSGVFTEAGTFTFTIEVSDTADTKASRELSIAVTAEPLLISTATLPDGDTATAYSARLEATGGVTPLTWATTAGALPQGLTLDGEGLVSGMPTEAGTFTVTIEVTDADGTTDDRELTFEIEDASPMITSMLLPPARAGGPYNAQIEVTGGTSPYTFTLVAGTLPNGLSMDGAGAITGLPDDDGSFTFTVEVTDANDLTDSLQLMILAVQEFTITTSALPLGLLGDAYDADLEATGGVPPYRWVLVNDTPLPAGLTLSDAGKISGTP